MTKFGCRLSLMQRIAVLGVILSCTQVSVAAPPVGQSQTQLDLLGAWHMSLEADAQWRSDQARLAAERELLPQARAALLPSVLTSASYYRQDSESDEAIITVDPGAPVTGSNRLNFDGTTTSYALELRQPLFNLGALKLYKSAKKTLQVVDYNFALARQALAIRLANAYFGLLLAEESQILAQSELKAIQRQLEQTQERFKVGLVSRTDVLEAEAAADQAEVAVAQAINEHAISLENLSIILGKSVEGVQDLQSQVPLKQLDWTIDQWLEHVLENNIQLKIAELNQATAKLSQEAVQASYWPTVDFIASHSNVDESSEFETNQYGVQATWQPFQGGGLRSRIREAELRYQSALEDTSSVRKTLTRDANNIYKTLATDIVTIKAQQQAIVSSESALEATRAGYQVGTRNIVDVLNAQRAVFGAKRDFAQARYTWILNQLEAASLDSSLSETQIEQVNQWLKKI